MITATKAPGTNSPTDEPFVTLDENRFAVAAVARLGEASAESPARLLVVYGPAGNGKSHLVRQFLAEEARKDEPPQFAHLTTAQLVAELDEAYQAGIAHELRERYLGLDLFVCEDLAALERKPDTGRLLQTILDETLAAGGRVLLTCSKAPGELDSVAPRLIDRFHAGVCAGITPPGPESRAQLLSSFAEARQLSLAEGVPQLLAEKLAVSPRELKAAVAQLDVLAHNERQTVVTRELAERFLAEAVSPPPPDLSAIAKAVARQFDVPLSDLRAGGRTAATSLPRQVAMSLAREITGQPLERIAGYFGRQNHGTVIHARKKLAARLADDAALRRHVAQIRTRLGMAGR